LAVNQEVAGSIPAPGAKFGIFFPKRHNTHAITGSALAIAGAIFISEGEKDMHFIAVVLVFGGYFVYSRRPKRHRFVKKL
jgi:hypothetical protein